MATLRFRDILLSIVLIFFVSPAFSIVAEFLLLPSLIES